LGNYDKYDSFEAASTLLMLKAVLGIHLLTRTSYILRNVKMEGLSAKTG
jgi:hypothetical protein